MRARSLRLLTVTTLLAGVGAVAVAAPAAQAATITYGADLGTAFANPERGFHNRYEIINDPAVNDYVNAATIPGFNPDLLDRTFARAKANGNTLIHSYVHLDKYKTQPLPQALLDNLASGLAAVRAAGMKVVLRPAYTWDGYVTVDEAQILSHIGQLNAVITANADVVLHLETGYLGAWGEWHTGGLTNPSSVEEAPARYRIVKKIADTTPATIPLVMRYPIYIKEVTDPTSCVVPGGCNLTQAQEDRIGFHNDCFLADYNDMGTYDNPSWMGWYYIEQKKQWMYDLATSTGQNKMVGGETCGADGYNDAACVNAQSEMQKLNFTEINEDYAAVNTDKWRAANLAASGNDPAETCFTRIKRKLGYRLRLLDATFPTTVAPGGALSLSAHLSNDGWSGMIKTRPVYLVLDNGTNRYNLPLSGVDPRNWLAGASTLTSSVTVPAGAAAGTYKLALWLPDPASGLQGRPEYSVRLANTGTWDAAKGYNVLSTSVSVGTCTGDCVAPSVPSGLTVSGVTNTSVSLSWAAASDNVGVTGYQVFRDGVSVGSPTTTSYTDTGRSPGQTYQYTVRARDAAGNVSGPSSAVSGTTSGCSGDCTAPSAPTLSSPGKTDTTVALSWTGSTDNVGVTGYEVFRGATLVGSPAGTTFTDTGRTASTAYSYTVKARDAAGNRSAASNTVTVTTDATAPPPTGLALDNFDGTPAYPSSSQNDLGKWTGANCFLDGGGSGVVTGGALSLRYNNCGWFGSDVGVDLSAYTYLVVRVKGTAGGEQSHFNLGLGGSTKVFSDFTLDGGAHPVITTSYQDIRIPMTANGINRNSPSQLAMGFWYGGNSTITIDHISFQ
jgi:chitodextrinase